MFRRYEKVIFGILSKYPVKSTIQCGGLEPVTYAAQLRNAMRSHCLYKWASVVDPVRLLEIRRNLEVTIEPPFVVAHPRTKSTSAVGELVDEVKTEGTLTITDTVENDVWSIAWLLGRGILKGPVRFTNPPEGILQRIQAANYDIAGEVKDNILTML